jgi:hypothetical protein
VLSSSSISGYAILKLYTIVDDESSLQSTYIVNGSTVILVSTDDGADAPRITYGTITSSYIVKTYGYRIQLNTSTTKRTVLLEKLAF